MLLSEYTNPDARLTSVCGLCGCLETKNGTALDPTTYRKKCLILDPIDPCRVSHSQQECANSQGDLQHAREQRILDCGKLLLLFVVVSRANTDDVLTRHFDTINMLFRRERDTEEDPNMRGLVIFAATLAALALQPASTLTGEHVCHRVENYTVTSREQYVEPVEIHTLAWCLQIPPRCPQTRTELRERWRMKTEVKFKSVPVCCEGYAIQEPVGNGSAEA
ncbi:hypothetical protein TSAR_009765, partial [Trichomalopsis sarcophagae]